MKKLSSFLVAASLLLFIGCKKQINTPALSEEISVSASKPPGKPTTPSILQWQRSYGSSATDMGFAVTKANDGSGYVLAGNTLGNTGDVSGNHGGSDAWIVKIDLAGNILWQKTFGGSAGDNAYDIVATSDGGYIFSGSTSSTDGDLTGLTNHGGIDVWVVKLSASGEIEWQNELGGSGTERGDAIIQTPDGGYLLSSSTNSTDGDVTSNHGGGDAWLIKLSSSGNLDWQKTYGGSLNDGSGSATLTTGGFIVCGSSASTDGDLTGLTNRGGSDTWVYAIDGVGNLLWGKTYGGTGSEGGGTIYPASGGFVFSTTTNSNNGDVSGNHGYVDTWVVNIDAGGTKIWQKCFGGFDMDNARIRDIDASGNIVLTGYTFSRNGDIPASKGGEDLWVMRLDRNGNKLYSNVLGGRGGDMSNDAVPTDDGMYITAGRSNSNSGDVSGNHGGEDMWVVKFKF